MGENKYYCKIDGIIYNLKKIQDIIDVDPKYLSEEISTVLEDDYHIPALTALLLGDIIGETKQIPADYDRALKEYQARNRKRYEVSERYSEDTYDNSGNVPYRSEDTPKRTGDNKYYCRIDGVLYNLKKIQDIIVTNPKYLSEEISTVLENDYHIPALTALLLGEIIEETKEIPADYNEALKELQARNRKRRRYPAKCNHSYRCPRCGSTNIDHYSHYLYNYQCRRCKHTWSQCPKCGGTEIICWSSYEPNGGYAIYSKTCSKCKHGWMEQG